MALLSPIERVERIEQTSEELLDLATDLLASGDARGVDRLNVAWEQALDRPRAELYGRGLRALTHPEDRPGADELTAGGPRSLEGVVTRVRHRDGSWRRLVWSARTDGRRWYAAAREATERDALEQRALHDPLTGLPNRELLTDRLVTALARLRRRRGLLAVLFVDLDGFKLVNDGLGHAAGDRALVAVAARLRAALRAGDTLARLGGDEFVVLAEDIGTAAEAAGLARRVLAAFTAPFAEVGEAVALSASVGVATTAWCEADPRTLMHEADVAMYRAKGRGPGGFAVFDARIRAEVLERVALERDLRGALGRGELRLVYQPVVTLEDGTIAGCEALLRWDRPGADAPPAAQCVELAEGNGLILPIGAWALETACAQAAHWRREGHDFTVAVNVSARQLADPGFVAVLRGALRRAGLPAVALCLEVTETAMVADTATAAACLTAVRRLGVRVAIDDFGSGFASLSRLKSLPADILKLDGSFIAGLAGDGDDRAIVAAVVALAAEMGVSVVAEGVETREQALALRSLGCRFAQGHWYAAPARPEDLPLEALGTRGRPGLGDPFVIREFMRQIGIPARIEP